MRSADPDCQCAGTQKREFPELKCRNPLICFIGIPGICAWNRKDRLYFYFADHIINRTIQQNRIMGYERKQ